MDGSYFNFELDCGAELVSVSVVVLVWLALVLVLTPALIWARGRLWLLWFCLMALLLGDRFTCTGTGNRFGQKQGLKQLARKKKSRQRQLLYPSN